jgi:hypothetical protein
MTEEHPNVTLARHVFGDERADLSHDPQSPTDAADFEDDDPSDAFCERCRTPLDAGQINVEAFEMTAEILCPACADEALGGATE